MKFLTILVLFIIIVLFFPLHIGNSSCLFGYLTGICFYNPESGAMPGGHRMLDHYLRHFALLWWGSIGLTVYLVYRWWKKGNDNNDI